MRVGVTYYGNYQDWSLIPESVLHRDFARFKQDGVDLIILPTFWSALEGSRGSYRTSVTDRLNAIASIAAQYGVRVIHNIHTWYTGTNVPSYAGNQRNAIVDSDIRQAWLDFVRFYIQALDSPNVEGFQLFNELSHHSWSMNVTQEQFYGFAVDTSNAARQLTGKPLSARWGGDGTNGMEDRFYAVFDYFCTNYYDAYNEPSQLQGIVSKAAAQGRATWVTEYGLATTDDETQRVRYESNLNLFSSVGVVAAVNWWWSGLTGVGETRYNIADGSGNPRPAYYTMIGYAKVHRILSLDSTIPVSLSIRKVG